MDQRVLNITGAYFKDIPFSVRVEAQDPAGRKQVFHEYPNSDSRFIEDTGSVPKSWNITAFVSGPFWLDAADDLERVLNEPGLGTLVLPTMGTFQNVKPGLYTRVGEMTKVGEIDFELAFAVSRKESGPNRAPTTVQDVNDKGSIFSDLAGIDLAQLWEIGKDAITLINSATDLKTLTTTAFELLATYTDSQALSKVLRITNRIIDNPGSIIQSAAQLSTVLFESSGSVPGLFQQYSLSLPNGEAADACIELTNMGTGTELISDGEPGSSSQNDLIYDPNIPLWDEDTQQRIIRNRNRLSLVNSFRLGMLSVAYRQAVLKNYDTALQVQEMRAKLEEAYQRLINVSLKDSNSLQAQPGNKNGLSDLRTSTLEVLAQKEQNASKITELVNQPNRSAFNLSYQLYMEEFNDQTELETRTLTIRSLNLTKGSMDLRKNVEVLQR
jgi:hypothetical protein